MLLLASASVLIGQVKLFPLILHHWVSKGNMPLRYVFKEHTHNSVNTASTFSVYTICCSTSTRLSTRSLVFLHQCHFLFILHGNITRLTSTHASTFLIVFGTLSLYPASVRVPAHGISHYKQLSLLQPRLELGLRVFRNLVHIPSGSLCWAGI